MVWPQLYGTKYPVVKEGNVSRCSRKDTSTKERGNFFACVPLCSVKRQRACLGRDHPDLLQQLQNVCTQPIFDDFPSLDAKEVHTRVLDLFPNGSRRSAWHATLIRASKEPSTSNLVFIGKRTNRGRKAVVGEGCRTPADPLLQPIGAAYLSRTRASGSKMRDEGRRDDLILDALLAAYWPHRPPEQRHLPLLVSCRLFLALLPLALSGDGEYQRAIVREMKVVLYRYWEPIMEMQRASEVGSHETPVSAEEQEQRAKGKECLQCSLWARAEDGLHA